MNINDSITDVQHARAIISKVGESYQKYVIDKLREVSANNVSGAERQAEKIISYMEAEYVLNVANVLWKDKYDLIPKWLKEYGIRQVKQISKENEK